MRRLLMTALRTLELEDGPQPEIPPGWLRLDMTASGLGLTQLQLLSGSTSTGGLPRVLGHEMVGRVSELGAGVAAPAVGSLVVVDCLFGCGRCDHAVSHVVGSDRGECFDDRSASQPVGIQSWHALRWSDPFDSAG